ncbi:hypothetical protein N9R81_05290 [Flavobacteriales bacterium]|nr:hypothetical protein [Flavobacteriales bacterium]
MKLYYYYLGWGKIASFMVNIFGIGPVLAALLLGINHTFSSDNQVVQHAVVSVEVVQDYEPYFLFELENNAMAEFAEFRTFNVYEETKHYADATAIRYTIGKGLLGYDVVKETTVLP